ncbi:adenylate/guanylate cyclase domain-containing protein [Intrasporangium sp.]|uniref:adenylate/guanylate cyclase domain-containing protein n=1 Tax=Intrasporangium sp. TaxID=1925024 RepID=UPI00293AB7B9|nr:adenylate/guanylate cyclase domain-containing protein [Intrasporangium sp.]MDV3220829.1 adenylate/guanylate cyclase domain-containing protein [Intrasporangium sp.]
MADIASAAGGHSRRTGLGPVVGGLVLAIPVVGLIVLRTNPELDATYQHDPTHFWLVLAAAVLSAVTAYGTGTAAARRGDVRVMYLSLAFLSSAGFLGLHALATPHVLLPSASAGFNISTPVGMVIGSLFAGASILDVPPDRTAQALRRARQLRLALVLFMVVWAAFSLWRLPPFDEGVGPERASGVLLVGALVATVIYVGAALAYFRLWLRRGGLLPAAMVAALVLLAEAMVAVTVAPNWRYSWWEWHLLLLAAFVLVAWGAQQSWHEERFAGLYNEETVAGRRTMTILFADLKGFTSYSETHTPAEVTEMLNEYFTVAIPAVAKKHGGQVDRIIGDALMVTFNRLGDQDDHARRAALAGLELQEQTGRIATQHPGWPRFRVGINTGEVLVSVLGGEGGRTHTVIGDAVNIASRIEGRAPVGRVAITAETLAQLPGAVTEPLGPLELKGKDAPVQAYVLVALPG